MDVDFSVLVQDRRYNSESVELTKTRKFLKDN